jgi:hypothetical protein
MLALYVELICDGCRVSSMRHQLRDDNPETLRQVIFDLQQIARECEWRADGRAHYCPRCVIERRGEAADAPAA